MLTEYAVVPTSTLPVPQPFREPCMAQDRGPCDCWYHAVDWAEVHRLAVGILERCGTVISTEDVHDACMAVDGPKEVAHAVWSLFSDPIVISSPALCEPPEYINGQHRARAILDQGLAAVVVEQNPPRDPAVVAQMRNW